MKSTNTNNHQPSASHSADLNLNIQNNESSEVETVLEEKHDVYEDVLNEDETKKDGVQTNIKAVKFTELLEKIKKSITKLLVRLRADNQSVLIGLCIVALLSVASTLTITNQMFKNHYVKIDHCYMGYSPDYNDYPIAYRIQSDGYTQHFYPSPEAQSAPSSEDILNNTINQIKHIIEQRHSNNSAIKEIYLNLIES